MAEANRWLNPEDGKTLLALLPHFSEPGRAFLERRCIAPWQCRLQRKEARRDAIYALATTYVARSGHKLAELILADLSAPADALTDERRALVDVALAAGAGSLGFEALRKLLRGRLGTNQDKEYPPRRPYTGSAEGDDHAEITHRAAAAGDR